jgi:hemerythrin-like domain-containing protein
MTQTLQIGSKPAPSFDEPLEMLAACHERIEQTLVTLERLVRHLESGGSQAEARAAAQAVLRYFDTAGALHHQDEDQDLFPLLRERAGELGRDEICALIEELEREHHTMEAQWRRLRESLLGVTHGASSIEAEDVTRFTWLYRRHLARESAAVMPFAREALQDDEREALGRRMAARRSKAR